MTCYFARDDILNVYVFELSLASQILSDEVLPVDCVISHVEFKYLCDRFLIAELNLVKPHVFTDEFYKLV